MKALITWRYFLIPEEKFEEIKSLADELDGLRDRELDEDEDARKEQIINEINEKAEKIARKAIVYQDDDKSNDGTITEELVFRMDEAPEVHRYSKEFYFPFLVYATPGDLQQEYETIKKIFDVISGHNLLREEFLGKWEYLERAKQIFEQIRAMYEEAYNNKCAIIKTDKVEWIDTDDVDEDDVEEFAEAIEEAPGIAVTGFSPEEEAPGDEREVFISEEGKKYRFSPKEEAPGDEPEETDTEDTEDSEEEW